jgi:phosphonate transport system permease protein
MSIVADTLQADPILSSFRRKRRIALAAPALLLLYFAYIFTSFDILGIAQRARVENAAILMADFWSHKTHVTRDNRSGQITVAIEGEAKGTYPSGVYPEWVNSGATITEVSLRKGYMVELDGSTEARFTIPGYGTLGLSVASGRVALDAPEGELPNWISASNSRVTVTTPEGRLTMTRARTEVYRYQAGWELFFFTLDSPFYGKSFLQLATLAVSGPRIEPDLPNALAMVRDIWTNKMWRHGDVMWAIFETILMAFLGTMTAALVALPLAFLAAANFTPLRIIRQVARRIFDFVRGVDGLIWTIILSRAFGPGPMTGALAIAITDTGSFGKMFSEALENVDQKQIEGIASTGAPPLARYRFGVVPQLMPVLLSQVLYYLESNTRSATVIGAITGGGIGLLLTQAIITQKDWEEVSYYILLIVLMVMVMDSLSGWLRRRLITGNT